MAINKHCIIKENDTGTENVAIDMDIDTENNALNWLVFKDQTTGTLYKLTINNGEVSLVQYTP